MVNVKQALALAKMRLQKDTPYKDMGEVEVALPEPKEKPEEKKAGK